MESIRKYSVLMSVYHKENPQFFEESIYSMVNQTCPPDEIVLVEDGPLTEDLYKVISKIKQEYPSLITSVINDKNEGLGISLQKGVATARNEIIARMDTDDISIPVRCEKQIDFLINNKDISVVGGQISEFNDKPANSIGKRIVPCDNEKILSYMKKRCPFNHMTVMFKKSDIISVGNYQDWFYNEDYSLWIRLAEHGKKFANLSEVLVDVRVGNDTYLRRGGMEYYKSEKRIQSFMRNKKMISNMRYLINITERFILQMLLPNKLRTLVFKRICRE